MDFSKAKKDFYTLKAKRENVRARSFYKLQEMDEKFLLIKKHQQLLDLGCAPGSWSQYCFKKTQNNIHIVGLDLTATSLSLYKDNFFFIQENIFNFSKESLKGIAIPNEHFDGIISDVAPKTSGIKAKDSYESFELVSQVISLGEIFLKEKGFIIFKYFLGEEFQELKERFQKAFKLLKIFKPQASRKDSKELFFIGEKK